MANTRFADSNIRHSHNGKTHPLFLDTKQNRHGAAKGTHVNSLMANAKSWDVPFKPTLGG